MFLLRILLIVLLLYFVLKAIGRWLFSPPERRVRDRRDDVPKDNDLYGKLTDQTIEDAEYEEIDKENKP
ncbi:MAG: hypothetical protein JSV33_15650 [bacterium]|nr:MAG: hypothetical protein JSV33_15650 [bacterium]